MKTATPVFIKTLGDQIQLWFELEQDIDCLNGRDALSICEGRERLSTSPWGIQPHQSGPRGHDHAAYGLSETPWASPSCSPTISPPSPPAARTPPLQLFEEGDYEVALDYEIKDQSNKLASPSTAITASPSTSPCATATAWSYPFDVATGAELTNTAVTENGFLPRFGALPLSGHQRQARDACRGRATGLTEDVRFNRPARDGEQYTEEGIYTITVSNRYTGQQTVKQIYVGTNKILLAHMVTGLSIEEVREQIAKGAQIAEDGTIIGMIDG